MQLKDLTAGQSCVIERIDLPDRMKRHLEALGMTDRAPLSVLNRKGKGIMIVSVRGSRFALGYQIAESIEVQVNG